MTEPKPESPPADRHDLIRVRGACAALHLSGHGRAQERPTPSVWQEPHRVLRIDSPADHLEGH